MADIEYLNEIRAERINDLVNHGKNANFTQYDNELSFIYDYKSKKRIPAYPHIQPEAKFLLLILKSYCIENKYYCFPGREHLSDVTGFSASSINRYLATLEMYDLIDILVFESGIRRKNVFIINTLDKGQCAEDILFHGDNQPQSLKPRTIRPEYSIEEIINIISINDSRYIFIGHKKMLPKKTQPRDSGGKFTDGQIDRHTTVKLTATRRSNLPCNYIDLKEIEFKEIVSKKYKIIHTAEIMGLPCKFRDDKIVWYQNHEYMAEDFVNNFPDHPISIIASKIYEFSKMS